MLYSSKRELGKKYLCTGCVNRYLRPTSRGVHFDQDVISATFDSR